MTRPIPVYVPVPVGLADLNCWVNEEIKGAPLVVTGIWEGYLMVYNNHTKAWEPVAMPHALVGKL